MPIHFTFSPSLVAIYLNQNQIDFLKNNLIRSELINVFFEKIQLLFRGMPCCINYFEQDFLSTYDFLKPISATDERSFLYEILQILPESTSGDPDIDEVFFAYIPGIYPFLDSKLTKELQSRHIKYLSQYSYSENLPLGIVPYFLSREFLLEVPGNHAGSVHDFLLKNINHFDTEIFYVPPDLRQYRLNFSLSDHRSIQFSERMYETKKDMEYSEVSSFLLDKPDMFRLGPSYIELEIIRACENSCTFCPRSFLPKDKDGGMLDTHLIKKIIAELTSSFGLETTFCLGGLGEPLLHPSLPDILIELLNYKQLQEIIIETSLYPDINKLLEYLKTLDDGQKSKISFIINLTTIDPKKYQDIYNSQIPLDSILEKIHTLTQILPNVHLQFLKIQEVEEELDKYFDLFEHKQGFNIILQKYNSYAGLMPEKRVTNLTPIKREFCWHLARDIYINANGDVSICKQHHITQIGNLHATDLKTIWNSGQESFRNSIRGEHEKINAPCLQCDEWYTFNA
ncbi:MAG: spiro-SPASM protein [Leptospiraceae bacterium]|nr:spiro-SPASM protein [Leptospiraceae bacterium]